MPWFGLIAGCLMLGIILFWLGRSRLGGFIRLPREPRVYHLLLQLTQSDASGADMDALRQLGRSLMVHLIQLDQHLKHPISLPVSSDGEPRLMSLARDIADGKSLTSQVMTEALNNWQDFPLTSQEIAAFPLCIAVAERQRLHRVLTALKSDLAQRREATVLMQRLEKSRRPEEIMEKNMLNTIGLASLLRRVPIDSPFRALLDAWLDTKGLNAESITLTGMDRQLRIFAELRRTKTCFDTLSHLNWTTTGRSADPLHNKLLQDPSGTYPQMTAASQLQLRLQMERFSRHVHMDAASVADHALALSENAAADLPERYAGSWFFDAEGMISLHHSLNTRRGWLYARLALRQTWLHDIFLWTVSLLSGFLFLQSGQPVFMLPFYALTVGPVFRRLGRFIRPPELPAMELVPDDPHARTLVLLHAQVGTPKEAIRAVRNVKSALATLKKENCDILLALDPLPAITAVSSDDLPIIQAAHAAISALEGKDRVLYIQRGRTWNSADHHYCARAGRRGALGEICRLIAQGECEDLIAFSTVEPASLERKYAYVLCLPAAPFPSDLLSRLVQTIAHPMCSRMKAKGRRGGYAILTPQGDETFEGIGLIRPNAYLEATDGLLPNHPCDPLCGVLAGCAPVRHTHYLPRKTRLSWDELYARALDIARLLPWQMPYVHTPSGFVRNPLDGRARFHLRELLRPVLIPAAQMLLMLYAIVTHNPILMLISLFAPELCLLSPNKEALLHLFTRISLLPSRAAAGLLALLPLRKKHPNHDWVSIEVWTQGLSATLLIALAIVLPGGSLPALGTGLAFGLFPLAHRLNAPESAPEAPPSPAHIALLETVFASSWSFFCHHVDASTHFLPPCAIQQQPAVPREDLTSPDAIGGYLLACICAKDVNLISANDAAQRMHHTIETLKSLSRPLGLFAQMYRLSDLAVVNPQVDTASVGFLLAALLTSAQALRTWLPELSEEYTMLSGDLTQMINSLDFSMLYDQEAQLFHAGLDEDGQPHDHLHLACDASLLLSVSACALEIVPPLHLTKLQRLYTSLSHGNTSLSQYGTASEHLLPGLFLPIDETEAKQFIRAMLARGRKGLFGQDPCRFFSFDPSLRYHSGTFGLASCALSAPSAADVFAPHAAALALPYLPRESAEALVCFRDLGALTPDGYCDAIDLSKGVAPVHVLTAKHLGVTMAAVSAILADSPIRRYFCSLPEVEGCLPLLIPRRKPLILPRMVSTSAEQIAALTAPRIAASTFPPEVHLLGVSGFCMTVDAQASFTITDGRTKLLSSPGEGIGGLNFYIADEDSIYRLGDPSLPGQTVFGAGEVCFEQRCGSLRTELVCFADALHRRAIHRLTITNLSTRDRLLDLANCLFPDLGVPTSILEPSHPSQDRLTLRARGSDLTLHHTLTTQVTPFKHSVYTDTLDFLGRGGTWQNPHLSENWDHKESILSPAPCLGFRIRVPLAGRGQAIVWYTTSLVEHSAPDLSELENLRQLAGCQHMAIAAATPLQSAQSQVMDRLLGLLFHRQCRISLHQDTAETAILLTLTDILARLSLHGINVHLQIICPTDLQETISSLLEAHPAQEQITFSKDCPAENCSLELFSSRPLPEQLDSLYVPIDQPTFPSIPPQPALLPRQEVNLESTYGGFDPDASDYLIQLEPGQLPPVSWHNRHISRNFSETTFNDGFGKPYSEQVWLTMADGSRLTPWSQELPRAIRMGRGYTEWEAWSDKLDVKLTASYLPGHRCGLRVLRIRNATDTPVTLSIHVSASFAPNALLEIAPGMVVTTGNQPLHPFLAGDDWRASRTSRLDLTPDGHDIPHGNVGVLQYEITLQPQVSTKAMWLFGYARHSEDIARALASLRTSGSSKLFHKVRAKWAEKLDLLATSTPEETLTLLMNRILPLQAGWTHGTDGVPSLSFLSPADAKRALIRAFRNADTPTDWTRLALLTSNYSRITGDASLWTLSISGQPTLYDSCKTALLAVSLDRENLPIGENRDTSCFLYAMAAHALNACHPHAELTELHHKLLTAADLHLWQDGYYGKSLQLDVQCLAFLALGDTPRTRQALRNAWEVLYDRPRGLIRQQLPDETPTLPGLPENGGMVTEHAALYVHALLHADMTNEAFELLRALNPLHHTDDPERQETFRCAPYLLHGGMLAAPMTAGQGVPNGGEKAASLLYAVILRDVLGFRREGNVIRIRPCVPPEWDEYTVTLREGASTWRISVERRVETLTIDGEKSDGDCFTIADDGRIHRIHVPLK